MAASQMPLRQEMMEDVLSSQKWITESYNTFANECSSPALKSNL
jgi:hypothetical protein